MLVRHKASLKATPLPLTTRHPLTHHPPQFQPTFTFSKVSLLGSILSNTLLVLGCACLAGGLRTTTPKFNKASSKPSNLRDHLPVLQRY